MQKCETIYFALIDQVEVSTIITIFHELEHRLRIIIRFLHYGADFGVDLLNVSLQIFEFRFNWPD